MQAAQVLAGYSLGGADLLRRAMGKKIKAERDAQRQTFVEGCAATNGIPEAKANELFDLIDKFAGYGFNKSHAAAYALLAYGRRTDDSSPLRMGVIVARSVGKAVVRNRVRRRVKAVGWELAQDLRGLDVVVRALPASSDAGFADLDREVRRLVGRLAEGDRR